MFIASYTPFLRICSSIIAIFLIFDSYSMILGSSEGVRIFFAFAAFLAFSRYFSASSYNPADARSVACLRGAVGNGWYLYTVSSKSIAGLNWPASTCKSDCRNRSLA